MKKEIKSYLHEFLELNNYGEIINEYELNSITINTLCIEVTFIDKVMAIKRHAICGTLNRKVRHIYDIYMLFQRNEIQLFLHNKADLKRLLEITKQTDSYYLQKRNINSAYNPIGPYNFSNWIHLLTQEIKDLYENLHNTILYTDEKQNFDLAIETLEKLNDIFNQIGE